MKHIRIVRATCNFWGEPSETPDGRLVVEALGPGVIEFEIYDDEVWTSEPEESELDSEGAKR